jgi:hypothetical protein
MPGLYVTNPYVLIGLIYDDVTARNIYLNQDSIIF